ncbi:phage protein NinX family protein [Variovorax sp. E3]|uniref:phage protein NinX family protein n=1 Tax=Variovorax sp. E3 TaxID=1914993 RepID=UPI0018DB23DD
MNTSELTGAQLDQWVAKAVGREAEPDYSPSSDWTQGGPILEREGIHVAPLPAKGGAWCAISIGRLQDRATSGRGTWVEGPSLLVAGMRALVTAKFGPTVNA